MMCTAMPPQLADGPEGGEPEPLQARRGRILWSRNRCLVETRFPYEFNRYKGSRELYACMLKGHPS
jgi:hypothetical protein